MTTTHSVFYTMWLPDQIKKTKHKCDSMMPFIPEQIRRNPFFCRFFSFSKRRSEDPKLELWSKHQKRKLCCIFFNWSIWVPPRDVFSSISPPSFFALNKNLPQIPEMLWRCTTDAELDLILENCVWERKTDRKRTVICTSGGTGADLRFEKVFFLTNVHIIAKHI